MSDDLKAPMKKKIYEIKKIKIKKETTEPAKGKAQKLKIVF